MEHFAEFSSNNIVKQISAGKDGKINGDNLDIYVTTNSPQTGQQIEQI